MTDAMMYTVWWTSLLLLVFLIWKEYKRSNRGRLVWRILTTIGSIASLICIALPISYPAKSSVASTNDAILLTEGFNNDSVAAFLQNRKNIPVYTYNASLTDAGKYQAVLLTSSDTLSGLRLHVFGYGLDKDQLSVLKLPFVFYPSPIEGFTSVYWPEKIHTGESLLVQGRYKNTSRSSIKITLSSYRTTVDSVIVPAATEQQFTLATIPKQLGRAVFTLAVIDKKDTLQKEPVPVQIEKGEPVHVLVLASSPDFENRFVKNWLSEKGYSVLVRTAVSKNRFNKEYLNIPETSADRISAALLDKFDIIIADASELAMISKGELAAVQSHVSQKSTGLIIRSDSAATARSFYSGWFPLSHADSGKQSVQLSLPDTSHDLPPLSIDHVQFIRPQYQARSLLADNRNRSFAAIALYGSGRIILTTLPNSYAWMLSGNNNAYHAVWSELLNAAIPEKTSEETWQVLAPLPKVHTPVTVALKTQASGIPQAEIAGTTIYMQQDPWLPYQWTGTYWPAKSGWQTGIGSNGQPWYWYTYTKEDWQSVEAFQKEQMNIAAGGESKRNGDQVPAGTQQPGVGDSVNSTRQPVNKRWFFLVFLFSVAYLWFENKYYNR
jgi:acyl-CoA hydrolase